MKFEYMSEVRVYGWAVSAISVKIVSAATPSDSTIRLSRLIESSNIAKVFEQNNRFHG